VQQCTVISVIKLRSCYSYVLFRRFSRQRDFHFKSVGLRDECLDLNMFDNFTILVRFVYDVYSLYNINFFVCYLLIRSHREFSSPIDMCK